MWQKKKLSLQRLSRFRLWVEHGDILDAFDNPNGRQKLKVTKTNYNHIRKSSSLLSLKWCVKQYIEEKINKWKEKGEFEKIATYQKRVNEESKKIKVKALQEEAIEYLKNEYIKSNTRYQSDIVLKGYDTEDESFLIKIKDFRIF